MGNMEIPFGDVEIRNNELFDDHRNRYNDNLSLRQTDLQSNIFT